MNKTTGEKTPSVLVDELAAKSLSDQAYHDDDVFGNENGHQIQYKTLEWKFVGLLMISEVVTVTTFSLPIALAVVGIVPAVILIILFGMLALYTAILLINFKLNHPEVHNMGDAGYVMFGPIGREIFATGSIIFAIAGAGALILSTSQALSVLSDQSLCMTYFTIISSLIVLLIALPRKLGDIQWLGFFAVIAITLSGVLAMIGAGLNPTPGRVLQATASTDFYNGFLAISNPVISYAGHFIFFTLVSEMRQPQDAIKSACLLQGFATTFYVIIAVVLYVYLGPTVQGLALLSLPPVWTKVTFGVAIGNFFLSGALCAHFAAKVVFVRLFRRSRHLYSHTVLGWSVWVGLCFLAVFIACIFSLAVPIFSYFIGIAAALFASWYTYGIAGMFWLHDTYHLQGGMAAFRRRKFGTAAAVLTVCIGAFICVAGTFVFVKLIVDAYRNGLVGKPFSC